MKLITAIALLGVSGLVGTGTVKGLEKVEQLGYERGVASSPQTPCYPFVKKATEDAEAAAGAQVYFAASTAYQQGVVNTIEAVKSYILDNCISNQEFTVDGEQFVCLKKQEM